MFVDLTDGGVDVVYDPVGMVVPSLKVRGRQDSGTYSYHLSVYQVERAHRCCWFRSRDHRKDTCQPTASQAMYRHGCLLGCSYCE